jgi:hypothetical protein
VFTYYFKEVFDRLRLTKNIFNYLEANLGGVCFLTQPKTKKYGIKKNEKQYMVGCFDYVEYCYL